MLEYALIKQALAFVDRTKPANVVSAVYRIADAWYFIDARRRRLAAQNIITSGITNSRREASRIARQSMRNFATTIVESIKAKETINSGNWRDIVELDVPEETMRLLEQPGRSVILVSGHLGNWEVAAHILSQIKPVEGITRVMKNPLVEELIQDRKPGKDFHLIPKRGTDSSRFINALSKGHVLAILMDQYARDRGAMINFFGRPASTHISPAMLHLVTRAPICFGYCVRTGLMSYRFKAEKPLVFQKSGDKDKDIRLILETLTSQLEQAICKHSEQYLWAHRRWR